jgi:hypothetical protein
MRKQRRLILFFALAVFIYGVAQVWNQQRSPKFEALLLDFLPKKVVRIEVAPADEAPFALLQRDGRWLITARNVNEAAREGSVLEMLSHLNTIRTTEIVAKAPSAWAEYGVDEGQGAKFCLIFADGKSTCVRLAAPKANQSGTNLALLYARLEGQPEVYACRATSPQYLGGAIHDYRSNCLLNLADSPHRMVMQLRDTTLVAQLDTGVWHVGQLPVGDAAAWQAYTQALRHPCSNDFVDDLDELALDSLLHWQLTLYTTDDSVSVRCYRDTQQVQPYLLHATQYPHLWLGSDSIGLYRLFTDVWSAYFPR